VWCVFCHDPDIQIVGLLSRHGPSGVLRLARLSGLAPVAVRLALGRLEPKGRIRRTGDASWKLARDRRRPAWP
jgi:hypothetical protein